MTDGKARPVWPPPTLAGVTATQRKYQASLSLSGEGGRRRRRAPVCGQNDSVSCAGAEATPAAPTHQRGWRCTRNGWQLADSVVRVTVEDTGRQQKARAGLGCLQRSIDSPPSGGGNCRLSTGRPTRLDAHLA